MSSGVCAIIVTFHPDHGKLLGLLNRIRPQVDEIVLIDNGSPDLPPLPGVHMIHNQKNEGLAAALNRGLVHALERDLSFVVLFDQDSQPNNDMIGALRADFDALNVAGKQVAAIGPSIVDARNGEALPFVRFGFPFNRKLAPAEEPQACDFLITSGTLIPLQVLREIGLMREGLFIDNIDMEWCARAVSGGFELYGSAKARMLHELGDNLLTIPLINHTVAVHSPVRLYYFMRNRVLLYRLPHVRRTWVAQDLLRIPVKIAVFSILAPKRLSNLKCMLKGLADGVAGIEGEFDAESQRRSRSTVPVKS